MEADDLAILRHEFQAEEGSFLLQLRCDMQWDKTAFDRATQAMRRCCQHYEQASVPLQEQNLPADEVLLPRWLADGFWYMATFVPDHTSHPAWEQTIAAEPTYFEKAYDRLEMLAEWFFGGQCPWLDEAQGWASTVV